MPASDPIIGSVDLWPVSWAPVDWVICNGALLPINQYAALFSLLGTTFGGNGSTTFGIPNLQGRVAVGAGTSPSGTQYALGAVGGAESVTAAQMPAHTHGATLTPPVYTGTVTPKAGTGKITLVNDPTGNYPGQTTGSTTIYTSANNVNMGSSPVSLNTSPPGSVTVQSTGSASPMRILPPYQVLNYIIALNGIYPQRP
jgi:microcystin-dependent protein